MPGPPRKPTKLRILEGKRAHRPVNDNEPHPSPGLPTMPKGLSSWGKRVWRTAVEELDRLDLMTIVDHGAFEAAVIGADTAHEADRRIRLLVAKINKGKGEQEDFYRLSIMNSVSKKGWQQFKSFATEFGMTPASRTRLAVEDAGKAPGPTGPKMDPIERVLCG
jgi:P27 family predicted phage terminase small subunit